MEVEQGGVKKIEKYHVNNSTLPQHLYILRVDRSLFAWGVVFGSTRLKQKIRQAT